jgi:hypothetical protein
MNITPIAPLLLLALVLFGQAPHYVRKCEIKFHVVDSYGKPIRCTVRRFTARGNGSRDSATLFSGLDGANLEPGAYDYEIVPEAPYRDVVRGFVILQRPSTWITRVVWESAGDFAFTEVPGTVRPYSPGKEPTWVRTISVYDGGGPESKISDDGTFMLPVLRGKYLVLVCRGSEILYNQIYEFPLKQQNGPLKLRLNSN